MEELDRRIKLEALVTRREGMLAENYVRMMQGNSLAYDDEGLQELANEMEALIKEKEV